MAFAPARPALRRRTTFAVPHGTGAPWRRTIGATTPSPWNYPKCLKINGSKMIRFRFSLFNFRDFKGRVVGIEKKTLSIGRSEFLFGMIKFQILLTIHSISIFWFGFVLQNRCWQLKRRASLALGGVSQAFVNHHPPTLHEFDGDADHDDDDDDDHAMNQIWIIDTTTFVSCCCVPMWVLTSLLSWGCRVSTSSQLGWSASNLQVMSLKESVGSSYVWYPNV